MLPLETGKSKIFNQHKTMNATQGYCQTDSDWSDSFGKGQVEVRRRQCKHYHHLLKK
jgi:hypothetical protein